MCVCLPMKERTGKRKERKGQLVASMYRNWILVCYG